MFLWADKICYIPVYVQNLWRTRKAESDIRGAEKSQTQISYFGLRFTFLI